jgi:hypothetical protein
MSKPTTGCAQLHHCGREPGSCATAADHRAPGVHQRAPFTGLAAAAAVTTVLAEI